MKHSPRHCVNRSSKNLFLFCLYSNVCFIRFVQNKHLKFNPVEFTYFVSVWAKFLQHFNSNEEKSSFCKVTWNEYNNWNVTKAIAQSDPEEGKLLCIQIDELLTVERDVKFLKLNWRPSCWGAIEVAPYFFNQKIYVSTNCIICVNAMW